MNALTLQLSRVAELSNDQFFELCQANRDIRIERTAGGELILMAPTGGSTSQQNADLVVDLGIWNRQVRLGIVFDSNGGFILPNGATRAPDASWLAIKRWNDLTPEQREKFPPVCPDFVVELRPSTDRLSPLQAKMQEYIDNGARLGWLINRKDKQVEIYRPDRPTKVLQDPASLSGEDVLPGFSLRLKGIL